MNDQEYCFYPFNSKKCVWKKGNKAIIKCAPLKEIPKLLKYKFSLNCFHDYYCGYVLFEKNKLPEKWREGNYNVDHLDMLMIHGGLTYGQSEGDYVVFGFDTNHAEDDKNLDLQNLDYIIKITNQMEDQIKAHADNIEKYRELKTLKEKAKYLDEIRKKAEYIVAPNIFGIFCFGAQDDDEDK